MNPVARSKTCPLQSPRELRKLCRRPWSGLPACLPLMALLLLASPLQGQEYFSTAPQEPIMKGAFFNTAWGSLAGVLIATAIAILEADKPTSPDNFQEKTFTGATTGGVIGFVLGLTFIGMGVSFHEASIPSRKILPQGNLPQGRFPTQAQKSVRFFPVLHQENGLLTQGLGLRKNF